MLQEAIDDYIRSLVSSHDENPQSNTNTIAAYRNDLGQFCHYLNEQSVPCWSRVTEVHVDGYLLEMHETHGYRPTTVARKLAALKSFFRTLRTSGKITNNPLESFEIPHVQKELPAVLSAEQVRRLFAQVDTSSLMGCRDLAMMQLLYATGMRVTELVSLNVADFDPAGAAVVCPVQHKRERVLPLSSVSCEAILHYLQTARLALIVHHPTEQALFVNHHGERLTRQGFWLIIKRYARLAGVAEITPHMLRHSFALHMLQQGMELRSVQRMLGHAHVATTQVYSQLIDERTDTHSPDIMGQ